MKKRKFIYVPGIISLIGLPLLLVLFGTEDKKQETLINFHLPSANNSNENTFLEKTVYNTIKHKKIEEIYLNDYVYDDREKYLHESKIEFIKHEIETLEFTNDTSKVIKVRFGDLDSYGDYVKIVNLALIYRIKRYAFIGDNLYIIPNDPPPPPDNSAIMLPEEITPVIFPDDKPLSKMDIFLIELKIQVKQIFFQIKQNLLLFLGFILLIFIPSIINLFRKKSLVAFE